MEHHSAEGDPQFSASKDAAKAPDSSSPSNESPPSELRDWSSGWSSSKASPTDESKPQASSPTNSSPFRNVSLGPLSNSPKSQGSPQSQKTAQEETKPVRRFCCNPVHVCLVLGLAVALGSIAMTVCGYMSHQLALHTMTVGNDTIIMIDEELQVQIEKFRTFGPVLIGLGSFVSMCACVLMCEARDEKKRKEKKLLVEEEENEDYMTRQKHMYALQREVMECEARHSTCPLYQKSTGIHAKLHDDVAYADESSHSSPVVLVHGPSLAEEKLRNDSQESNDSEAAKASLLREPPQIKTPDATSIPTCSNYLAPEKELETTFTATPRTVRKGIVVASPPVQSNRSTPERPSNLSPIKSRSVNGPIAFNAGPTAEGVCICVEREGEQLKAPPKGGKSKREKRGTRKKERRHENKTAGSDSGSAKSVPRHTKSVATQNTDLVTHVNPLHDIPVDSFPQTSPQRTQPVDTHRPQTTGKTTTSDRISTASSLAPVETPREDLVNVSRTSKSITNQCQRDEPSSPIWVKQKPRDLPSNNNNEVDSSEKTSQLDVGGASAKEAACDSNSNVPSMSSMQLSPKTTPSNAMYDVIHDKTQSTYSSTSGVVL